MISELALEQQFIAKLEGLKYERRADIRDRASLEANATRYRQSCSAGK